MLVSLVPTELFPRHFRRETAPHYGLKALGALLVWARCLQELLAPGTYRARAPAPVPAR